MSKPALETGMGRLSSGLRIWSRAHCGRGSEGIGFYRSPTRQLPERSRGGLRSVADGNRDLGAERCARRGP
jgi:hypothetical protein